ncbi:MAG: hypothetical protein NVSMB57_12640 [Actinomycetota bacterium]
MSIRFHHAKLPDHSGLLVGRMPAEPFGFRCDDLQIWFNNTDEPWRDDRPHAHCESEEVFIVLGGQIVVNVEGEAHVVGPRELICFPRGVFHLIVEVRPPVETFMIRSASIDDKIYQ